ncbi:alpha-L-fucosidase [Streptomyces sp. NPDC056831]|uniref:alpha-L-fucosidase n=1 Tax=Streptomyces sp. NPDC056831 TaxID=3345954 RepID=UPI0036B5B0FB
MPARQPSTRQGSPRAHRGIGHKRDVAPGRRDPCSCRNGSRNLDQRRLGFKNGNFLLGIGPKAGGTIPDIMQRRLRETGEWLKTNGETICFTPWHSRARASPSRPRAGPQR